MGKTALSVAVDAVQLEVVKYAMRSDRSNINLQTILLFSLRPPQTESTGSKAPEQRRYYDS